MSPLIKQNLFVVFTIKLSVKSFQYYRNLDVCRLTNDMYVGILDEGRVCGDLTFVEPLVTALGELDLQLPVVWLLVDYLEPGVAAVGLAPVGQQVGVLVRANTLQPRNLGETKAN